MYKANLLKIEDNEYFYNEKTSIKYFSNCLFDQKIKNLFLFFYSKDGNKCNVKLNYLFLYLK